jgi:hypothetical protein
MIFFLGLSENARFFLHCGFAFFFDCLNGEYVNDAMCEIQTVKSTQLCNENTQKRNDEKKSRRDNNLTTQKQNSRKRTETSFWRRKQKEDDSPGAACFL